MKRIFVFLLLFMTGSTLYGIALHRYNIFPYQYFKYAYEFIFHSISNSNFWSICIYSGSSPFQLADSSYIKNPVLTG